MMPAHRKSQPSSARVTLGIGSAFSRSIQDNLYSLKYVLNSPRNRFVLDGTLAQNAPITASDDGQAFVIQATAAQSQACAPDVYQLIAVLIGLANTTAAGQQVTLPLQDVTVDANVAGASGPVDTRSMAKP